MAGSVAQGHHLSRAALGIPLESWLVLDFLSPGQIRVSSLVTPLFYRFGSWPKVKEELRFLVIIIMLHSVSLLPNWIQWTHSHVPTPRLHCKE